MPSHDQLSEVTASKQDEAGQFNFDHLGDLCLPV